LIYVGNKYQPRAEPGEPASRQHGRMSASSN
jgi:hypothetical protein